LISTVVTVVRSNQSKSVILIIRSNFSDVRQLVLSKRFHFNRSFATPTS